MKPIYKPTGKAKEYGDYAVNIYTGCPHRCFYCFAPNVLHRERTVFHENIEPRKDIVKEMREQIARENISGKTIHLCFTCDPYPTGYDTCITREIIKVIKESGNFVQILTKGDGSRDFDLLTENDWYGVTLDGADCGGCGEATLLANICTAHDMGIKTWVSFEPVINAEVVLKYIEDCHEVFDRVKIGKLNYHKSDINWDDFGRKAEELCKRLGVDYYIKESLRKEMEAEK